ncbi:MAG: hypothetical protein ABGW78_13505 [Pirellulales bacterium]
MKTAARKNLQTFFVTMATLISAMGVDPVQEWASSLENISVQSDQEDSQQVSFPTSGGNATLKKLITWKKKSIWTELAK